MNSNNNNELPTNLATAQLLAMAMQNINNDIEHIKRVTNELASDVQPLKSLPEDVEALAKKVSYIDKFFDNKIYMNRNDIGKQNVPVMTAQTVSKLFAYCDIWSKTLNKPKARKLYLEDFSYNIGGRGQENWVFHFEEQRRFVEEKLKEDGLFKKFTACIKPDDLKKFIDDIYYTKFPKAKRIRVI